MRKGLENSTFSFQYRLNTNRLPAQRIDRRYRLIGFGVLIFSLMFGGSMLFSLLTTWGAMDGDQWVNVLLVVGFAVMALVGWWMITLRVTTVIDRDVVSRETVSVFGRRFWQEPMSHYQGVLQRSEYHRGSKNSPAYTIYIVELYHAIKKRRILLYQSMKEDGLRTVWEDYCRQLGQPGLEKDGEEICERQVADLDKTVRELAMEGKLESSFDPLATPPQGLRLSQAGAALRVEMRRFYLPATVIFPFVVLMGLGSFVLFFTAGLPWAFVLAGCFLVIIAVAACWSYVVTPVLLVGHDTLRLFKSIPWGETVGKTLDTQTVESVRIGVVPNSERPALVVEGDSQKLVLGAALSNEARIWLKRCVLAVAAHNG